MMGEDFLKGFEFKAVVDWLELSVKMQLSEEGRATNGWTLWELAEDLKVSYVKPLNRGSGGAATEFLVRIQQPESMKTVRAVVAALAEYRGLAEDPVINAIEVSFDAYAKDRGDFDGLDAMTVRLMNGLLPPSKEDRNPRQTVPFGGVEAKFRADPSQTYYVGANSQGRFSQGIRYVDRSEEEIELDPVGWRVYRKTKDECFTSDGERMPMTDLALGQCRARAEVTLRGPILKRLGLVSLDDLATFDFAQISNAKLLRFAIPQKGVVLDSRPLHQVIVKWFGFGDWMTAAGVVARPTLRKRSRGRRAAIGPYLKMDSALNSIVSRRLERLTRNFQKG